jgi:PAS domain S-box-containing protein
VDQDEEEKLLRSVAIQNAKSILLARQRAEQELLRAKEALEQKTEELATSLSMMRATLESTTDGILVTNEAGKVTDFNEKYVQMWRIPRATMSGCEHRQLMEIICHEFNDPGQFLARIENIYAQSPPESFDLLELADGRVFERCTKVQIVNQRKVGRVWCFRDITEQKKTEEALRENAVRLHFTLESARIGDWDLNLETGLARSSFWLP